MRQLNWLMSPILGHLQRGRGIPLTTFSHHSYGRSRSSVPISVAVIERPKPGGLEKVTGWDLSPTCGGMCIQPTSLSIRGSSPHSLGEQLRIIDCVAGHAYLFSRLTRAHLRLSPSLPKLHWSICPPKKDIVDPLPSFLPSIPATSSHVNY
jgi:hypothetical protein